VAVVSFRYWQDALGGEPSAIGSSVELNGIPVSIVGVAPPEFFGDTLQPEPPSFWIPIAADRQLNPERSVVDAPDQHWLYLLGRLSPGVSRTQAEAQLTASLRSWLVTREGSTISEERQRGIARSYVELTPGGSGITRMSSAYSTTLRLLLGLSLAVLLIACANIANLLLARTDARRAESALRLALGASRARLLSLVFTESLILALAGGALALFVATAGSRLLLVLTFGSADHIPISTWPDIRVLAFTFALACVAGALFGLLPAVRTSADIASSIRGSARGIKGPTRSRRLLNPGTALVVAEVAVSLVLLAGAGSFSRSLANLTSQPFGFTRDRVLVVDIDPGLSGYDYQRLGPLYDQLASRLNALPGVTSASLSRYSPFNGCCWSFSIAVAGYTPRENESTSTLLNRVSPRYFDTLGTRVLRGRVFDAHDSPASPRVAVVNEAFAQRYFRAGDPIGGRYGIDSDDNSTPLDIEIVGVVENTKYDDPRDEPRPMAFLPLLQVGASGPPASDDSIFVHAIQLRTVGRPGELTPQVRETLAAIDPTLVVLDASPLSLHVDRVVNQERVIADLATFFGGVALVLACVGLYGLMAYTVQKRTGEIGVRMALGARRSTVVGIVVKEALLEGIGGITLGIPIALAASQLVARQLYGVNPADPVNLAAAATVLLFATMAAGLLPARRAARIDPIRVLRHE
jgi:predicted permease